MYPAHTQLVAKWSSPSIGEARATGCTQNLTMTGTGMTTGTDMRTHIGTEDTEDVLEIGSIHKLGTIEPGP